MATGNLILGTMRKKLGDVVAYTYNGKQAARVRRRTIANPKSDAQCAQRMIAATVSHFMGAFSEVLNNAVQTETTKVATLAKLRSLNMQRARLYANIATPNRSGENFAFTPKGSNYVAPAPWVLSVGTLPGLSIVNVDASDYLINISTLQMRPSSVSVTAAELFPTLQVGQQITLCWITGGSSPDMTTWAHYCRFAFLSNNIPALIEDDDPQSTVTTYKLNPAAVDQSRALGNWQEVRISELGEFSLSQATDDDSDFMFAAGVIISEKNGKRRSNSVMKTDGLRSWPSWMGANVWPTYGNSVSNIGLPSELYLNNDTEANQQATSGGNRAPARVTPALTGIEVAAGQATVTRLSSSHYVVTPTAAEQYTLYLQGLAEGAVLWTGDDSATPVPNPLPLPTDINGQLIFSADGYSNVIVDCEAYQVAPAVTTIDPAEGASTVFTANSVSLTATEAGTYNVGVFIKGVTDAAPQSDLEIGEGVASDDDTVSFIVPITVPTANGSHSAIFSTTSGGVFTVTINVNVD